MNTKKSEKMVRDFQTRTNRMKRKKDRFDVTVEATPEEFFQLLCPTLEADWLPGWDSDLIFTKSGYAEEFVVFQTKNGRPPHPMDTWIFNGYKPNEYVKIIIFTAYSVVHLRIYVRDNGDGTVTGRWEIDETAITELGNRIQEENPEKQDRSAEFEGYINSYLANKDSMKSRELLTRFKNGPQYQRRTSTYTRTYTADKAELYKLLCPTREADWIPGWKAELVYTESGYAEDKTVWLTSKNSLTNKAVWAVSDYRENELFEFSFLEDDLLTLVRVRLNDGANGTVTVRWDTLATAVTEKGNDLLGKQGENDNRIRLLADLMEHYLEKGQSKGSLLSLAHKHIKGKKHK